MRTSLSDFAPTVYTKVVYCFTKSESAFEGSIANDRSCETSNHLVLSFGRSLDLVRYTIESRRSSNKAAARGRVGIPPSKERIVAHLELMPRETLFRPFCRRESRVSDLGVQIWVYPLENIDPDVLLDGLVGQLIRQLQQHGE
jgi:hypothetical protein